MLVQKELKKLPIKNFQVHYNKDKDEYYGVETDKFKLPRNIYGEYDGDIEKYLKNFSTRKKNLGILLSGIKGAGKTLMAKMLCLKSKLPVLIINEPFCGNKFNEFISSIDQEVILFFDEFEKIYKDNEAQEELLTLFDGTLEGKKLFLLTTNTKDINPYFKNRPSRIHYFRDFGPIDIQTLGEIIKDTLKNKDHEKSIVDLVLTLGIAGKDLVISLIEEINLTNKDAYEVVKTMNIDIEDSKYSYTALVKVDGKRLEERGVIYHNPLNRETLSFSRWEHGFRYEQYISSMKKEVLPSKMTLEDGKGNVFVFRPVKEFNALDR